MVMREPPSKEEVNACAAALRAFASLMEYAHSIEGMDDMSNYRKAIHTYIKGVGSVFLDEIDATGVYERKTPSTEDPNMVEYVNSIAAIALHGLNHMLPDEHLPRLIAAMADEEFAVAFNTYFKLKKEGIHNGDQTDEYGESAGDDTPGLPGS